jgi:hypothetical protein
MAEISNCMRFVGSLVYPILANSVKRFMGHLDIYRTFFREISSTEFQENLPKFEALILINRQKDRCKCRFISFRMARNSDY